MKKYVVADAEFTHYPGEMWCCIERNGNVRFLRERTISVYYAWNFKEVLDITFEQFDQITQFLALLGEGKLWEIHNLNH